MKLEYPRISRSNTTFGPFQQAPKLLTSVEQQVEGLRPSTASIAIPFASKRTFVLQEAPKHLTSHSAKAALWRIRLPTLGKMGHDDGEHGG